MKTGFTITLAALLLFVQQALPAQNKDWAGFHRYEKANAEVTAKPRAVLIGDSITDGWASKDPDFFTDNNLIGRGISGQTSSQILVRVREDAIALSPKYLVILCGFNDIARNEGAAPDVAKAVGSIMSMCEIAKANKVTPIVCSQLPSYSISWRPEITDAYEQVLEFNKLLKAYARKAHIKYVDYFNLLADKETGRIADSYSDDTVHPTLEGYKVMEEYLLKFLY